MSGTRCFRGVSDSYKQLPPHWQGDMETGFPARIKAVREDGVSLWYLPSDEVEASYDRRDHRIERMIRLIHDMHRALKAEDKPHRLYGLDKKIEGFEARMEELAIEVEG